MTSEKSTTASYSSLFPAVGSKAAGRHQADQLLVSSSHLHGCVRRVFVAQQQNRSLFQLPCPPNAGDLVYRNKRRFYYLLTYAVSGVTVVCVALNTVLLMSGLRSVNDEFDAPTVHTFMSMACIFSTVLYVLSYALLSRTVFSIYYNESTRQFLGICYNWRLARKNLVFKPGDVQLVPDNSRFAQFFRGAYRINKQPYHISSQDFVSARHYNVMLGFIKP